MGNYATAPADQGLNITNYQSDYTLTLNGLEPGNGPEASETEQTRRHSYRPELSLVEHARNLGGVNDGPFNASLLNEPSGETRSLPIDAVLLSAAERQIFPHNQAVQMTQNLQRESLDLGKAFMGSPVLELASQGFQQTARFLEADLLGKHLALTRKIAELGVSDTQNAMTLAKAWAENPPEALSEWGRTSSSFTIGSDPSSDTFEHGVIEAVLSATGYQISLKPGVEQQRTVVLEDVPGAVIHTGGRSNLELSHPSGVKLVIAKATELSGQGQGDKRITVTIDIPKNHRRSTSEGGGMAVLDSGRDGYVPPSQKARTLFNDEYFMSKSFGNTRNITEQDLLLAGFVYGLSAGVGTVVEHKDGSNAPLSAVDVLTQSVPSLNSRFPHFYARPQ